MSIDKDKIRNIAIIAHIDHGKSTLADRLIEYCGGLEAREMRDQVLDSMDIERERGITIKAQTVRLLYKASDGNIYQINLIDTPGHVDFAYEVSRSLAACDGSLLVIDSTQGVEAQTLANVYIAIDNNHEIILVLNKIDLPASDPDKVKEEIEKVIGLDAKDSLLISAKNGIGIRDLLEAVVFKLPYPKGQYSEPLKALLIDSWYDVYLGVIILVRIVDGTVQKGLRIKMMVTGATYVVEKVGCFTPKKQIVNKLTVGEIGFITANIKQVSDCKIGDTITEYANVCSSSLPGFKSHLPVVFCGLYPTDATQFERLRESLEKLKLNDSSFQYEPETSVALGFGFRCGFLGLLHLEIIQERLEREFNLDMIVTTPNVIYLSHTKNGESIVIHNPSDLPSPYHIDYIEEPWVKTTIIVPEQHLGNILSLCSDKRGRQIELIHLGDRIMLVYLLPLNEIAFDFYDKLKSLSKGYASFDWKFDSYVKGDLIKLNILVNKQVVEALSIIIPKSQAYKKGQKICQKLKELIPRQMFQISIQAAIDNHVIVSESIKPLRKDVLAKCYGGDITRKRKLIERQKEGKKKMRSIGNVEIPQSAFIAVFKTDKN